MPSLIDPGIALRVQPPKLMTPAEAISLKQLAQQGQVQQMDLQERQRKQREQVALRDIASQPGAMDKTGYTEDALVKIAQINPQLAVQARQQQQEAMNKAFAAQATKVGLSMKQNDQLQESLTGHLAQYQEMAKKLPPEQAKADFAQNWNKYLDDAAPTGMYTPEQIAGMRQIKSPDDALKVVGGTKFYKDMMSVQNQEKSQERAAEAGARADRRLEQTDTRIEQSDRRLNATLGKLAAGGGGGKPPSGYTWSTDPATGERTLTPIKGGPADKAGGSVSKQVQQLGKDFEKANLPTSIAVIEQAEKITPELAAFVTGPKSLLPDWSISKEAREAKQDVQKLFNITLKDRSGAAVTNQELERLKKEFGTGTFKAPGQLIDAIGKARRIIEKHYASIAASHGKAALDAYNENVESVGGKPFEMRGDAVAAPAAAPGAYSDAEKERRYQEWKAKQK